MTGSPRGATTNDATDEATGDTAGPVERSNDQPLVTIGLPVHNGDEYLTGSIESLLGQTYANIELIICDNASDDRTQEICEKFAAADDRVRYHRNEVNIGGAQNHNLTFTLARGTYFRWAAHDDLAEPELIERCVTVLEGDPDIVVCHTDFAHIDADGETPGYISRNQCGSPNAYERFATMAGARDFCEETYGVIRADIFGRTNLQQDYTGSDRTLMSEIALYGRFHNVEECLFQKRLHDGNEYIDWRTRMAWFGDKYKGRIVFPWWTQLYDYLQVIRRVPLTARDRVRCNLYMAGWVATHAHKLTKDAIVAGAMLFRSRSRRVRQFSDTENWA
jgi:glycosyltransferase involved in cell wall biosynthesis